MERAAERAETTAQPGVQLVHPVHLDLRYRAMRAPLGEGLRPDVASVGDLVRMVESLGREEDIRTINMMPRVVELDRGLELGL